MLDMKGAGYINKKGAGYNQYIRECFNSFV